jgi:GntR family transcriptional regulator/MocR family aminotransferase
MAAPDHRDFPVNTWTRLTKEVYANCDTALANYRDPTVPSLLEVQIAEQIAASRGIKCEPENVVTTLGAHHAVSLLTELLVNPGDKIAFELPGMPAVRSIFLSSGCQVTPMLVDEAGANPFTVQNPEDVRLAFLTAAKQQPLTTAMPVNRKLEMLHWAAEHQVVIIEDDLGSEFRYQGRPIPPLKALDHSDQVIYVGAFSMILLQTLRLGYMIMPKSLARKCRQLIQVRYRATPQLTEQIAGRFIQDGHFSRHLHRMRREYAKRQEHLLSILRTEFADVFFEPKHAAGFYNLCYFRDNGVDESHVLRTCRNHGLGVEQLSYYYPSGQAASKALLVGFAASSCDEISMGCKLLKTCLQRSHLI